MRAHELFRAPLGETYGYNVALMPRSTKLWAGLYGLAFHLIVIAVLVWIAAKNQANVPAAFWWTTAPPFLLASFAVYALLVGPYLPRRPTTKGAVFLDSAVGMIAECTVVVLTAILYAFVVAARGDAPSGGYLGDVASTAAFAFLWSFGSFFTQILVVGNAAGLIGWLVIKKISERRRPAPPAPRA